MQHMSWDDLRVLLAAARAQSLAGAAVLLNVNATTVSRRIKALEASAGTPLFLRDRHGTLCLTDQAQRLADQAEAMERHAQAASEMLGNLPVMGGTVRLTAVPFILNRIILPEIRNLTDAHPALQISLVPDSRNLSLTRREVDIALRFGKPTEGGDAILARRMGQIRFAVFTARHFDSVPVHERPWLCYDPVTAQLPQAVWTQHHARKPSQTRATLFVHDIETAFETARHAPVRAVLPAACARRDGALIEVETRTQAAEMTRDVWLMRHRELRGVPRIEAMVDWLNSERLFA